jgi:dihydrofolate synthase / folylpolyglutamate synthase
MSYREAVQKLAASAPELTVQPGQPRRKFSLDEIRILLAALGNPHQKFCSILIAGTNGKGSTAATLASILVESGLRTGLYTSPHLERVNERIRVNRATIPDDDFARHFFAIQRAATELIEKGSLHQPPSFFETLTALAFLHFADCGVEIAVLEVGMGGRLDATNIVDPLLSIITDISLDHMEWLGDTIELITREKAGILRANGTLITLPQLPAANQVIGEVATELDVRGVSAVPYMPLMSAATDAFYTLEVMGEAITIDSPLIGAHQLRNRALAIAAAVELSTQLAGQHQPAITPAAIASGIHHTEWPARLERIHDANGTEWVLDVAHNPAGAWALRAGLSASDRTKAAAESKQKHNSDSPPHTSLIFSCLRDKPVEEMAQILFPLFDKIFLAPIHSSRATGSAELLAAAAKTGSDAQFTASVEEAIALAAAHSKGGRVVIAGSVYLVGEARARVLQLSKAEPSVHGAGMSL